MAFARNLRPRETNSGSSQCRGRLSGGELKEAALPETIRDYDDAIRWIFDRINYERVSPQRASEHFRLERVEQLLSLIGAPQTRIPTVHIAGTKGKGSTAAIVDSILRAAGIRSGLFTSPHINQFEERMLVCGAQPSNGDLTSMVRELKAILSNAPSGLQEHEVTYFEVATLLAWMYFDRREVEIAVLETGLGGRLDTTNVCRPLVTVITVIGLDHTHILGDTIAQIAIEKAGIIKPGVPVLTAVTQPEAMQAITERADAGGCLVWRKGQEICVQARSGAASLTEQRLRIDTPVRQHHDISLGLAGTHQADNAALAVATADCLTQNSFEISTEAIAQGVASAQWPMRFEVIESAPKIVLDVAHNEDAVAAVADTWKSVFGRPPRSVLIFGSSRDKNARAMLRLLVPLFDEFVFTEFQKNPRARSCTELADLAVTLLREADAQSDPADRIRTAATPGNALAEASRLAGPDGVVAVVGSFFLAAEVRELIYAEESSQ